MTDAERIEKLTHALDWYAGKAMALKAYVIAIDQTRMLDVMRELAVDNGARAREARLLLISQESRLN